jgi:drug/metabolite transporter (DMT)-like permease
MILALTCMWSPSFLFIKLAIQDLPPITIVTLRVGMAAFLLICILLYKRQSLPKEGWFWFHSLMMAIVSSAVPMGLFCYAEQSIDSALAALLNGGSPIFTALLSHTLLTNDKLTPQKALGIGLSLLGMVIIFIPNILMGLSGSTLGMLAGIGAAFSYGVSHVYAKKFTTKQAPFVSPTAQLIACTLLLVPFSLWFEAPLSLPMPSTSAMIGVGGMTIMGTFLAYILYFRILEHCGPTAISMVACFFPVFGMVLGFLFLDESMTLGGIMAAGLVLFGMMLVTGVVNVPQLQQQQPDANLQRSTEAN